MAENAGWRGDQVRLGDLDAIVVFPAGRPATHTMVLCHGFGAPGDDLAGLAGSFASICDRIELAPVMVFPEAPIDLASEGMPGGRAWWRLNMAKLMELNMKGSFDQMRDEVPPGIDEARGALVNAIEFAQKQFQVEDRPLLLGGFSQGAMLAVDTALRGLTIPPSAMAIYSGALLCESLWRPATKRLGQTRIFQCHGRQDFVLPVDTGIWLGQLLEEHAQAHELHLFDGPHTIPQVAIGSRYSCWSDRAQQLVLETQCRALAMGLLGERHLFDANQLHDSSGYVPILDIQVSFFVPIRTVRTAEDPFDPLFLWDVVVAALLGVRVVS